MSVGGKWWRTRESAGMNDRVETHKSGRHILIGWPLEGNAAAWECKLLHLESMIPPKSNNDFRSVTLFFLLTHNDGPLAGA